MNSSDELDFAVATVRRAAAATLERFQRGDAAIHAKPDGTIVTDADLESDAIIRDALVERFPQDALLSEEAPDDPARVQNPRSWIVDPIDGTTDFADGRPYWAVLLALAHQGRPVLGVVARPALGSLVAGAEGLGAFRDRDGRLEPWGLEPPPLSVLRVAARRGMQRLDHAAAAGDVDLVTDAPWRGLMRALAVIDGDADAFVGDRTTASEWDFAAVDAVLRAAGGRVTDLTGDERRYNNPDPRLTGGIVAATTPGVHGRILELLSHPRE